MEEKGEKERRETTLWKEGGGRTSGFGTISCPQVHPVPRTTVGRRSQGIKGPTERDDNARKDKNPSIAKKRDAEG